MKVLQREGDEIFQQMAQALFDPALPEVIMDMAHYNAKVTPACTSGHGTNVYNVQYTVNQKTSQTTFTRKSIKKPCAQQWRQGGAFLKGEFKLNTLKSQPVDCRVPVWRKNNTSKGEKQTMEQLMVQYFETKVIPQLMSDKYLRPFACLYGYQTSEFYNEGACFKRAGKSVKLPTGGHRTIIGKNSHAGYIWAGLKYTCADQEPEAKEISLKALIPYEISCAWDISVADA